MIGDRVVGCAVTFREFRAGRAQTRTRLSVAVEHVGRNRVSLTFTRGKAPQVKSLTAKTLQIWAPDGRDLVAAWRQEPRRLAAIATMEPPR